MIYAGNDEQKKKYLGRMVEEPLMAVSYQVLRQHYFVINLFIKMYTCLVKKGK